MIHFKFFQYNKLSIFYITSIQFLENTFFSQEILKEQNVDDIDIN